MGVVTLGALLGMAAHLEGRACTVLDMTGLAQKFGAVSSHVRIHRQQDCAQAARIPPARTDLLLGADIIVASGADTLNRLATDRSAVVINTEANMPSSFIRQPDLPFPGQEMHQVLEQAARESQFLPATALAQALLGHAVYANIVLLGYAWQMGKIPLNAASIKRSIELNGTAIEQNLLAFHWGRKAALDLVAVLHSAGLETSTSAIPDADQALQDLIVDRAQRLRRYQNRHLARHYQQTVEKFCAREQTLGGGATKLGKAVAEYYYQLLAHKDEYEVARLFVDRSFKTALAETFSGKPRLRFHLAVPLLNNKSGDKPQKRSYGAWILPLFHLLAWLRPLRGSWLDPFRHTAERQFHDSQLAEFTGLLKTIEEKLCRGNHALAVELISLQQQVRGFGPVKKENARRIHDQRKLLLQQFLAQEAAGKPEAKPLSQLDSRRLSENREPTVVKRTLVHFSDNFR